MPLYFGTSVPSSTSSFHWFWRSLLLYLLMSLFIAEVRFSFISFWCLASLCCCLIIVWFMFDVFLFYNIVCFCWWRLTFFMCFLIYFCLPLFLLFISDILGTGPLTHFFVIYVFIPIWIHTYLSILLIWAIWLFCSLKLFWFKLCRFLIDFGPFSYFFVFLISNLLGATPWPTTSNPARLL